MTQISAAGKFWEYTQRIKQGLGKYSDKLLVLMRATPIFVYGSQPKYTTRQS